MFFLLGKTSKILLDKTGTLTHGRFYVEEVNVVDDYGVDGVLECVAYAESISNHPIAKSIIEFYGKDIDNSAPTNTHSLKIESDGEENPLLGIFPTVYRTIVNREDSGEKQ